MANVNAPFGFMPVGRLGGGPLSMAPTKRKLASNYSTAIYRGDPVEVLASGYLARGAAGETGGLTLGIFMGCKYLSSAHGSTRWSPYWPGSGNVSGTEIEVYINDDPLGLFMAQSSGTAITFADIGANVDFTLGTGSTATGLSGASIDQGTLAVTATLPFRIHSIPEGVGNGFDASTSYNRAIVMWNDQFLRQFDGVTT